MRFGIAQVHYDQVRENLFPFVRLKDPLFDGGFPPFPHTPTIAKTIIRSSDKININQIASFGKGSTEKTAQETLVSGQTRMPATTTNKQLFTLLWSLGHPVSLGRACRKTLL